MSEISKGSLPLEIYFLQYLEGWFKHCCCQICYPPPSFVLIRYIIHGFCLAFASRKIRFTTVMYFFMPVCLFFLYCQNISSLHLLLKTLSRPVVDPCLHLIDLTYVYNKINDFICQLVWCRSLWKITAKCVQFPFISAEK